MLVLSFLFAIFKPRMRCENSKQAGHTHHTRHYLSTCARMPFSEELLRPQDMRASRKRRALCSLPGVLASILLVFSVTATPAAGLILPPIDAATGPEVALVLLHGANVSPEAYLPLSRTLQTVIQTDVRLWIGLPDVNLNVPIYLDGAMNDLKSNFTARGLPVDAPRFLAGHSLGGVRAQSYAQEHAEDWMGGILMASVLLREYDNMTYPVPTLTVGGEKDGNMRVSRVAQASHVYRMQAEKTEDFPVVVVPGANHMSFASGQPPLPVALADLTAEISEDDGHESIAQVMAAFLCARLRQELRRAGDREDRGSSGDVRFQEDSVMTAALETTAQLVDPLIKAMLLEGSWHFQPPCNSDRPSPHCPFYPAWPPQPEDREPSTETNCVCGCGWVMDVAQAHVGDLEGYATYVVQDAFHDVRDTEPYHHAHLWNGCTTGALLDGSCVLNITTVSELIFDPLDALDAGFAPVTAAEIRAKMKSRQSIYQETVDPEAALADTDKFDFCAEINAKAFAWAHAQAPPRTKERFDRLGVQPVFDPDIRRRVQIGPIWINSPLRLHEEYDRLKEQYFWHVQSPTLVTDVTAHIYPDSAGYHYCKLLSPARALEWIYVDGLRRYDRASGVVGRGEDGTGGMTAEEETEDQLAREKSVNSERAGKGGRGWDQNQEGPYQTASLRERL